jgi:hypothetical protein
MSNHVSPQPEEPLSAQDSAARTAAGAAAGDGAPAQIHTQGGAAVQGQVVAGGDFVGRDKIVQGDEVHGDKVAGDKNVFIDTASARWRFAVLLLSLLGVLVIVSVFWSNLGRIEETLTAPEPLPPPPPMTGDVNILIARPSLPQDANDEQIRQFQEWNSDQLERLLDREFFDYRTALDLTPQIRTLTETSDNLEALVRYADEVGADLLLYGTLDVQKSPPTYQPHFYIHPRFATGASELAGADAFGAPVNVSLTAQGGDSVAWKIELEPRLADLAAFITALGLYDARQYDLALEQFGALARSDEWQDEAGKAVLYPWIGTAYFAKALEDKERGVSPQAPVDCVAVDVQEIRYADCALAAYTLASDKNADYLRAYIGIGNYWLDFQEGLGCQRIDAALQAYDEVVQRAGALSSDIAKFAEETLVALKIRYQIGLAHATAVGESCENQEAHDEQALTHLHSVVSVYQDLAAQAEPPGSLLLDLAARAYYQMGLLHRRQGRDADALMAFEQARAVAAQPGPLADPWQSIYWIALNQTGSIHLSHYQAGEEAAYEQAYNALSEVTAAYEEDRFGGNYDTEPFAASAAWFYLGQLYGEKAQRGAQGLDASQLNLAKDAYQQSIDLLDPINQSDPRLIDYRKDGLPWISHLELGNLYALSDEAGLAIQSFHTVMDAVEQRRLAGDSNLAAAVYGRAALGMGKMLVKQGDLAAAAEKLNLVVSLGESDPQAFQEATTLLAEIAAQTPED